MFNFIPPYYTFKSRILTKSERISWFIIFPAFLFLVQYQYTHSFGKFIFSFIAIMCIYEVGYLFNDFVTTKKEINPTLRSGGYESPFYKDFKVHIFMRVVLGLAISLYYAVYLNEIYLAMFQSIILILYYFHNTIRNRFNVVTYFFLVSSRYLGVIYFLDQGLIFIIVLLVFPVCRTIEHSCKKKYGFIYLKKIVGDADIFRIRYYFLLSFCLLTLYLFNFIEIEYLFFSLYFLIFRSFAFIVRNKVKRTKHQAY